MTWWVVFVPLWIYFGVQFLGICVEYSIAQRIKESLQAPEDPEAAVPSEEDVSKMTSCLLLCLGTVLHMYTADIDQPLFLFLFTHLYVYTYPSLIRSSVSKQSSCLQELPCYVAIVQSY